MLLCFLADDLRKLLLQNGYPQGIITCNVTGPAQQVFEWGGGGGGGLKDKQVKLSQVEGSGGMLLQKFLILTPLKCREMHSKLINEILKYKLSVLKKRYFYSIEIDKHLFSPIIYCSAASIDPKINQEYNHFTSTEFNLMKNKVGASIRMEIKKNGIAHSVKTEAVADIYCISDSLKIPKYVLLSLRSENSFTMSTRDLVCLFVFSSCLFNVVKLVTKSLSCHC